MKSLIEMNTDLCNIERCLKSPSLTYKNEKLLIIKDEENKHISIFISGSDDLRDLIQDIRFKLVPFGGGRIHKGFLNAAGNVLYTIISNGMLHDSYSYSLSGHSKGATSALICGMWLDSMGIKIKEVTLYGCPKITKHKYKLPFKCYNIKCAGDPITLLPKSCFGKWTIKSQQWIHLRPMHIIGRDIEFKSVRILNHTLGHYINATNTI